MKVHNTNNIILKYLTVLQNYHQSKDLIRTLCHEYWTGRYSSLEDREYEILLCEMEVMLNELDFASSTLETSAITH